MLTNINKYLCIYTYAYFPDIKQNLIQNLQVLNEANLKNAILVRAVLTRSDLGNAIIEGADFSDAVLDLTQKQVISEPSSKNA